MKSKKTKNIIGSDGGVLDNIIKKPSISTKGTYR